MYLRIMITMQNMFESYKSRIVARNPESSDRFELEDIANYRLLIKSHLYKSFRAKFKVKFGHLKEFNPDLFYLRWLWKLVMLLWHYPLNE